MVALLPFCPCLSFPKQFTSHFLYTAFLDRGRPMCLYFAIESSPSASLMYPGIQSFSYLLNFSAVYIYSSQENYKQGVWHKLYYTCFFPPLLPLYLNKTQLRVEKTFNKYWLLNA
jgi:hypothetical protein